MIKTHICLFIAIAALPPLVAACDPGWDQGQEYLEPTAVASDHGMYETHYDFVFDYCLPAETLWNKVTDPASISAWSGAKVSWKSYQDGVVGSVRSTRKWPWPLSIDEEILEWRLASSGQPSYFMSYTVIGGLVVPVSHFGTVEVTPLSSPGQPPVSRLRWRIDLIASVPVASAAIMWVAGTELGKALPRVGPGC